MSSATGSKRQDFSSTAKDTRKARAAAVTTEYIYLTEISPAENPHSSAYAKENVRRVASSSRHTEPARSALGEGNGEDAFAPHPSLTSKRAWKANYIAYLPAVDPHSQPTELRGATNTYSTLRANGPEPHLLPNGTRPLSLQKSSSQLAAQPDKVKARKDATKSSAAGDTRHMRHAQSSHPSRGINGGESPKWDLEKVHIANERAAFTGSIAVATWDHVQREVESLRKTVQELHKANKKQSKRIDELCIQATSQQQIIQGKDTEIVTIGNKCSKYEKLLSTVEAAIQCQICMELPDRPFTLAPCGHVLCLSCLQEWFKTSPGAIEDDDDENEIDAENILSREKTCPCCRTVVRHRPCPAFMVKDVASTFILDKEGSIRAPNDAAGTTNDDPWKDIFPVSDDEDEADALTDDDDLDDDDDDVSFWWMRNSSMAAASRFSWNDRYLSGSDDGLYSEDGRLEEVEEGLSSEDESVTPAYVLPRWEPPTVHIDPQDYSAAARENALGLLRRGCTWEMVQSFNIRYSHRHGIIVALRSLDHLYASDENNDSSDEEADGRESLHHVYLGWNISLNEDDLDGEAYMDHVLDDVKARPDRWRLIPKYDGQGSMDVKRLVPFGNAEDHSTTDTDIWLNAEEHDMDVD